MTLPDLRAALAASDLLFDGETLRRETQRIAADIDAHYADGERPVYLTVMHGGLVFAGQLALSMKTDLEFDYLHATRYRGATTGAGLSWLHRPATPLRGRRVLVADDILDEGHTLLAVAATSAALFWVAAVVAGLCMGSSQSCGRAMAGAFARYESVRSRLPRMPRQGARSVLPDLSAVADHVDGFLLDAFGVLNVGDTAIPGRWRGSPCPARGRG